MSHSNQDALLGSATDIANKDDSFATAIGRSILARGSFPIGRLDLLVTLNCNHCCDYCFVHGKGNETDMPFAVATGAVDFLLRASRGLHQVVLMPFGGEPLLRFDLVQEIVEYAEVTAAAHTPPKQAVFCLTTNGTLLDESTMGFFRQHEIMVLVSIDGDRETHDRHRRMANGGSSYSEVTARIPMIKYYQPWLGTRMTVHPDTAGRVVHNFRHLYSAGINQFIIGPATGVPWAPEEFALYEAQMMAVVNLYADMRRRGDPVKVTLFEDDIHHEPYSRHRQWGCGAGKGALCVAREGSLYPCSKLVGVDAAQGAFRLGDIWTGITDYATLGLFRAANESERVKCVGCDFRDDCCGGCPATNWEETGSLFLPSRLDCMCAGLHARLRPLLKEVKGLPIAAKSGLKHIRPIA